MYAMAYKSSFAVWLDNELKERGVSQSELARRANVTRSAVNGVLTGARGPGPELAKGISKAFDIPPEHVYREAGLLPPGASIDEFTEQIIHETQGMNKRDKEEVLAYIRMRKNLRRKE
jgi:transcriptional regulator with XRE-family HTH domain